MEFRYMDTKGKVKCIAIIVGVLLIIGTLIGLIVKVNNLEKTKTISSTSYSRGLLDDQTGKLPSEVDYSGIHTDDYIKVDGLKCELKENAEISYQINWYDTNKTFIGVTDHTENFDGTSIPENAKYCKIEIIPEDDNDGTVSVLEVYTYAKQLTVTVNK